MNDIKQPPPVNIRRRVSITFDPKEGKTQQSFYKDANVNEIMKKFQNTGKLMLGNREATYGHVPATTFHEAMNIVVEAEQMFAGLPSKLRKRFHHDPAEYMEFALNPDNRDEMAQLGLLNPEAAKAALEAGDTPASPDTPEGSPATEQPPSEATTEGG